MRSITRLSGIRISLSGLAVFALLIFDTANAQISAPTAVSQDRVNGISFGLSYGEHNDKDADFWGWSLGYSRVVGPRWVLAAAITWDEETERKTGQANTVVKAFTAVGTVSYLLSDSFTLTTGLAKGIANDENSSRSMKFKGGDVSTGLAVGYNLPVFAPNSRYSLGLSLSYEYNISEKQTSASADISLGWSF